MTEAPSFLQAISSLLIVLGMIGAIAYLYRRVMQGGAGLRVMAGTTGTSRRLTLVESLWLDARYRVVIVRDGERERTIVLGPERATELADRGQGTGDR